MESRNMYWSSSFPRCMFDVLNGFAIIFTWTSSQVLVCVYYRCKASCSSWARWWWSIHWGWFFCLVSMILLLLISSYELCSKYSWNNFYDLVRKMKYFLQIFLLLSALQERISMAWVGSVTPRWGWCEYCLYSLYSCYSWISTSYSWSHYHIMPWWQLKHDKWECCIWHSTSLQVLRVVHVDLIVFIALLSWATTKLFLFSPLKG